MMMKIRLIKAIIIKETLQISRDSSSILIALILPLILLFLMGYAVSLDAKNIPFGILSHSKSNVSKELISKFISSKSFNVKISHDKFELLKNMQEYKIKGFLIINEDLKMQILLDGTDLNTANLANYYVNKIVLNYFIQKKNLQKDMINISTRYWFNEEVSSRYFLIPGSIAVIMTLIGTLLTALVIAREWERGSMEALLATPITWIEIIIGKIIPYAFLAMFSLLLCFLVAYFWYEIPFRGSFWLLVFLGALFLLPALSIGLLISAAAKNQFVAAIGAIIAGFLPAFLLSGFIFEISNMPLILQYITNLIPAKYFVNSLQNVFLAGNLNEIIFQDILGMLLTGIFFFVLVLKKSKKGL